MHSDLLLLSRNYKESRLGLLLVIWTSFTLFQYRFVKHIYVAAVHEYFCSGYSVVLFINVLIRSFLSSISYIFLWTILLVICSFLRMHCSFLHITWHCCIGFSLVFLLTILKSSYSPQAIQQEMFECCYSAQLPSNVCIFYCSRQIS